MIYIRKRRTPIVVKEKAEESYIGVRLYLYRRKKEKLKRRLVRN